MRVINQVPIIPNRLVFTVTRIPQRNTASLFSYSIDNDENFQYLPFFSDFGPLSLLQIHRFWQLTNKILAEHTEKVQFYTSNYPQNIANACLLIASYLLIEHRMTPEEALKPIETILPTLKPYRDASSFPSTYDLTVPYCIQGLYKAMSNGWYKTDEFDAEDWGKYEQVENGDMNWLIPGKLLAFATPYATGIIRGGWKVATPNDLIPIFNKKKINHVVRLCQKFYDEDIFKKAGFKHTEMYFLDGSTPPEEIRKAWLDLIECPDVVGLHCKAGLGRTGTLAACYMIKNFGFTGHEAIGWIRICRPGSIIGPQQRYVTKYYEKISAPKPPAFSTPKKTSSERAAVTQSIHIPTKTLRNAMTSKEPRGTKQTVKRGKDEDDLTITTVALTPKYPQPRKYNRSVPMTPKK
jgi:cell division cycle 14